MEDKATVDPGPVGGPNRRVDASRFCGPQFISNLEGAVLGISEKNRGIPQKFTGGRAQQWLIHADPEGLGRVALASMDDGRYLSKDGDICVTERDPFYWNLQEVDHNIYTLSVTQDERIRAELPKILGSIMSLVYNPIDNYDGRLLILEAIVPESREILSTGAIGPYAYPEEAIYYTVGSPGQVIITNHMETDVYVSVSGETGEPVQFKGCPGVSLSWSREKDEVAHVSLAGGLPDLNNTQTFTAYRDKILHIQKMPSEPVWQGIMSVPEQESRYSPQDSDKEGFIGVQNNLKFHIYVFVLSSVLGGDTDIWTGRCTLKPSNKASWRRTKSEIVFVSVGSSPGVPRAFIGRPGFILQIDSLQ
ncbi:hypothetical protein D9611_013847 [Ephemerocybe angulata]|uniref:Uncharacterized protein n=1 Tax=Ephemerocybe angulata TaxID=980116 RepID=A0A8H5BTR4_9AGAR|nr:hypothetical protein D9611_013847 [Tulosesus angulatus]